MSELTSQRYPAGAPLRRCLSGVPKDRVVGLTGVETDDIVRCAAGPDAGVPAVLIHRAPPPVSASGFVRTALDDMESAAVNLFPAWLPGGEHIYRPGGAGVAAVRALALERAARSSHFGPFLGDLAELALTGTRGGDRRVPRRAGRFTPEIRAAGLARVVADSFGRTRMVLVVPLPAALTADAEHALVAGAGWLAERGRLGVWLVGGLQHVDWVPTVDVPGDAGLPEPSAPDPGVAGKPHPASAAEAALEAALAVHEWAAGRRWNQSYQSHVLVNPVRLDLLWPAERCVVEIDGPEHRDPRQFEADRQRDVQLQLDGYAVLRFTNARIRHDVQAVVRQIGTYLRSRRRETRERTAI